MNIDVVGDIHCQDFYSYLMTKNSIQLGDLCVIGYNKYKFDSPRFFIDGNHDHFPSFNCKSKEIQEVSKNLFYIPRGYVNGNCLFIGGADSIDKDCRTPGLDWFYEETINQQQLDKILLIKDKIEVILAHEAPDFIRNFKNFNTHRKALTIIFNKFKPKLWINAHHHDFNDITKKNCRFITIPQYQSMQFDLPIKKKFIQ